MFRTYSSIFLLLFVGFSVGICQSNQKVSRLKEDLSVASDDTSRVNLMNELSYHYMTFSPDSGLKIATEARGLSNQIEYKEGKAVAQLRMAQMLNKLGDFGAAKDSVRTAVVYFRELGDSAGAADGYNLLGNLFRKQGDYGSALDFFTRSLKIHELLENKDKIAGAYNSIGTIHRRMGKYELAKKYYRWSISIREELGESLNLAGSYINLGVLYMDEENDELALQYHLNCLQIAEKLDSKSLQKRVYNNLSLIYMKMDEYDEALKNIDKPLKLAMEVGDEVSIAKLTYNRAYIQNEMGLQEEAMANYQLAIPMFEKVDLLDVEQEFYRDYSSFLEEIGDFEGSLEAHRKYKALTDSIFTQETAETVAEIRTEYEAERKEQEAKAALADAKQNAQQRDTVLIALLLVLLLGIIALIAYIQKRKSNRKLANTLTNLKATQDRLIQSEKLASLGQITAGIAHEIQNPLNFVTNFSDLSVELSQELREMILESKGNPLNDELIEDINEYLKDIEGNSSKVLHHGNRADSIVKSMLLHSRRGHADKQPVDVNKLLEEYLGLAYHGIRGKHPEFRCAIQKTYDPSVVQVALVQQDLGRAFLNIMNNAFQAMNSKLKGDNNDYKPELSVSTQQSGKEIEIRIRDNGPGIPKELRDKIFNPFFTTKPTGEGTGLGLSLSYDMVVKSNGGNLVVDSEPEKYTEFIITIPIT